MFKVISCLAYEHDYSFVVVAAIVCIAGAAMTIRLFERASRLSVGARSSWIMLSGIACGAAIWTTHFVAMLGFQLPFDAAFDPLLTIASLLIAIAFTAAGLHLSATPPNGLPVETGGAVIGAGVVAMHFTGMSGFEIAGRIEWDAGLVEASILFAVAFGALAMHLAARQRIRYARPLSVLALVLAICAMHFTAMGAATIVPDPSVPVPTKVFSSEFLAVLVLATMAIIAGLTLYVMDAKSQRELVDSFRHAAQHDPLTGLPNRAFLSHNLPDMLKRSAAAGKEAAVIVVDLDRFKEINDVHGHHAGDMLLQTVANRLKILTGPGELVARVGGDEFIAVKQDISSKEEVDRFVIRLVSGVLDPVQNKSKTLSVGASIGISLFPHHASDADELIGAADLAMYRAKRAVTDKVCYYDRSMDEGRRERSALAMELRHALERDEFELYYQPQLDMQTGEVTAYEALLRWHHRERGLVAPEEFIPIAEENGLIIPIGEWVLRTACAEVAGWRKPYKIAVNIAAAQLVQADLTKVVHETLLSTGLAASRLELEITEASIIEDRDRALHVVRQLKALGVTIAMDDYGVGYSSLSTLQIFPFDRVKIDRSFVEDVANDSAAAAIVRATILLANDLRIPVLAEGVEKRENFEFLRAEGCTEMQGFLFGRPLPLSEIASLVGRNEVPGNMRSEFTRRSSAA
ncbi:diguanylate cyclase/phosphodiesterase [Aminobacter aminovorans]|uniref:Cyclic di-GMP phosphodiesterase Gmr n=1 Tax=Aminobacter aminovorans TaxID=83263 RepID=A0A380WF68_AMIAI|nr:bifunctional diguanylate cyclase/phosphodiesterase [Aminobacter aminovorans]TCS21268.1 diguanylate cyclase/phosphodiesterase [Aminobacter aminovorans]SUU87679.1 Cyclic di-GMP phosphodiesterase Gmr [Aminobacter aminovorans]